jgi:hypothetical protein
MLSRKEISKQYFSQKPKEGAPDLEWNTYFNEIITTCLIFLAKTICPSSVEPSIIWIWVIHV